MLATGRIGKPYCGYGTITGQGNGQGGREHGHKCDQLPGNRDIENPEHRAYIAGVWGIPEPELPGKGLTAYEIVEAIHRGEIKGLISICFNPLVSLPNNNMVREALEKLEFYVAIDFFLSETARHADIVLPGSLHEEEEGTVTTFEGRVTRVRAAVTPPGEARTDTEILLELARRLGAGDKFAFASSEDIFNELRVASKGGTADYYGITYERIEEEMGVFWPCPVARTIPGRRGSGRTASSPRPTARRTSTRWPTASRARCTDAEYPVILTTGRVVSQYLERDADAADRQARRPVPRAAAGDPPDAGRAARHRRRRTRARRHPARRRGVPGADRADHPRGHRLRALPLARAQVGQPVDVGAPRSRCRRSRSSR